MGIVKCSLEMQWNVPQTTDTDYGVLNVYSNILAIKTHILNTSLKSIGLSFFFSLLSLFHIEANVSNSPLTPETRTEKCHF